MKFDYLEPATIGEAITLLERYGDSARVLAGGTDLLVQMKKGAVRPDYVISLGRIDSLDFIEDDGQGLSIGPSVTMSRLASTRNIKTGYPVLAQAAGLVSVAVRHVATVGGNLGSASPSADTPPALIVLGATVEITGPNGRRTVLLEDFFRAPGKTVLGSSELLTAIRVPPPTANSGGVYLKYAIMGSSDLAIVGVAVLISLNQRSGACEKARIALGAVAPTPVRAPKSERTLEGKQIGEREIEECARIASMEARPITDVRAGADYRREMTYVFTRRAVRQALQQAVTER